MSSRTLLAFSVAVLSAAGAGCNRTTAAESVAAAAMTPGTADSPITITVLPAEARDLPLVVDATGSLAADEVSRVAPETSGIVAATPVNVGDRVVQGAVIARLNPAEAELRLESVRAGLLQAEAALAQAVERNALARSNAKRYDTLARTGAVSRTVQEQAASESVTSGQTIATAQAAVAEAMSSVALAEKALADTIIRAPFSGFVTERPIAVGEYVTTSSTMATVMKLDPIRLRLQVPELDGARLRVGQQLTVSVEALGGRTFEGRITAINPALDLATRAIIAEAMLPNRTAELRAGMFATARIALSDRERALFVPRAALLADPNTNSFRVFAVEGEVARLRVVQPGSDRGDTVRIVSGLEPGDHVATSALDQLYDGARVQIE
jgi:RND family efflux transporter MFP subunit